MRHKLVAACFSCLALTLTACPDDSKDKLQLSCDLPFAGSDIQGLWTLHATGTRTKCSDRNLRGDLTITSEQALHVTSKELAPDASTSESDAFVDRIVERSSFDLAGKSLPAHLAFDGSTDGSCVQFELTEDLGKGDELSYTLQGQISEAGLIEGNFTGSGPDDCETSGRFTIDVR